ncbi:hypothetical protein NM688_g2303 [Phlebia brevispora]|uniref:Uncharacterized protein n=1 Tax=Phlebia brevispora TaxID=194682 RepID=A0ACC1T916_9APHY|nr:hypothetical protein NM688_g2303 [Phlebia brevispora]
MLMCSKHITAHSRLVMLDLISFVVLLALCLPCVHYFSKARTRRRLPLPPGPKPWPIFGNIFDLPKDKPWVTYREWSSDLIYLDLPQQPTVILNTSQAILDLMEGRSKLYADKPPMVMDELLNWDWNFAFMPYGSEWRATRRTFHQHFNQQAAQKYHPIQTREIRVFLKRVIAMSNENKILDSGVVSQTFAATILDIVYGMRIHDFSDEFVSLSRKAVECLVISRLPGVFWVEYFPWLRHLPSWLPFSSARRFAAQYRHLVDTAHHKAFDALQDTATNKAAAPSVATTLIHDLRNQPQDTEHYKQSERAARDATGVAYAAAVDTQYGVMLHFFLAMVAYPDVQKRAQEDLDFFVGPGRLPTFEDSASLPFIQAILLEVLRWHPIVPLGLPHRAFEDDEYRGYSIPAGTIVMANTWAMLHDPKDYPDPEAFNPDRFMRDGALNPEVRSPVAAFGYGRRICPGRHLATESLALMIASILHVFNVEPTEDDVSTGTTTGLFSYPEKIPCRLVPRSQAAVDLINAESS